MYKRQTPGPISQIRKLVLIPQFTYRVTAATLTLALTVTVVVAAIPLLPEMRCNHIDTTCEILVYAS